MDAWGGGGMRGQDIREKLVSCSRDKYEAAGVD